MNNFSAASRNDTKKVILKNAQSVSCFGRFHQGFTLIELLVVVLIIGILTAVALPQYELAVEKSRAAEPLAVLRSLRDAQEVYYMANGVYAEDWENLDVTVPTNSKNWNYAIFGTSIGAVRKNVPNEKEYILFFRKSIKEDGSPSTYASIACGYDVKSPERSAFAERICKALGAVEQESSGRWILSK